MALDEIMGELAQYMRMQEEISQTVESLKDQLKQAMNAGDLYTVPEILAAWQEVTT